MGIPGTEAGGQVRNHLAHILADGSLGSWDPDADDVVETLLLSGSTIYAGGSFTTIGGVTRNRLAAIGTDGVLDNTWTPNCNGTVNSLAMSGSTIYVGGSFGGMDGVERNYLAAIGTDGTLSDSWNPYIPQYGNARGVNAVAVVSSTVYVGGDFDTIDSVAHKNLAAIGTDGSLLSWAPVPDTKVFSMAVSGTTLYEAGQFSTLDNINLRVGVAAIDTSNNNTITGWNPSISGGIFPRVFTVSVSGSTVYIGGQFSSVDSQARSNAAAVDSNGTLLSWAPTPYGKVTAIAASGSTVYTGGEFTMFDAQTRNRLAAIETDGSLSSWDPDADGSVYALAVSNDH